MLRKILTIEVLASIATCGAIMSSTIWSTEKADVTQAAAADKLEVPLPSTAVCAALATAMPSSDLFCYNGVTCAVVTTQDLNGIRGVDNANWNCFLAGSRCRPPFAVYPGLGCIAFIRNLVDFATAKTSCPTGSSLWYPHTNEEAETMRSYLADNRYAAPAGGQCGDSVPLSDGEPGPCSSSAQGLYCCNAGGTCGTATADCNCPTCINYKVDAKAFWIDLVQVDNETWKYGDGRILVAEYGVPPWGPYDPKYTTSSCGSLWMAPAMNTLYHHADTDCTRGSAYVCTWDNFTA